MSIASPCRFEGSLSHDGSLFNSERVPGQRSHLLFGTGFVIGIDQPGCLGLIFVLLCTLLFSSILLGRCGRSRGSHWGSLRSTWFGLGNWLGCEMSSSVCIGLFRSTGDQIVDRGCVRCFWNRRLSSTIEVRLRGRSRRHFLLLKLRMHSRGLWRRDLTLMHLLKLKATDRWSTERRTLRKSWCIRQTYASCTHRLREIIRCCRRGM